jgi:hypothetical protein
MAAEMLFDCAVCEHCDDLYIVGDVHYCDKAIEVSADGMDVDLPPDGGGGRGRNFGRQKESVGQAGKLAVGSVAEVYKKSDGCRDSVCGRYGVGNVRRHGSFDYGRTGCQWDGNCHECGAYEPYDGHCMCSDDVPERDIWRADTLLWRSGMMSFGGVPVGPDGTVEDPSFREKEIEIVEGELYGLGINVNAIDIPGVAADSRPRAYPKRPQPPYNDGYCYLWCFDESVVDRMWEEVDLPACAKLHEIISWGQRYPYSTIRLQIINVGKHHYHFQPSCLPGSRPIQDWITEMLRPGGLFSRAARLGYFGHRPSVAVLDGADDTSGTYGDTYNEVAKRWAALAWYETSEVQTLAESLLKINFSVQEQRDSAKAQIGQLLVRHPFSKTKRFDDEFTYLSFSIGVYGEIISQIEAALDFKEDGNKRNDDQKTTPNNPGGKYRDQSANSSEALDSTVIINWDKNMANVQYRKGVRRLLLEIGNGTDIYGRESAERHLNLKYT